MVAVERELPPAGAAQSSADAIPLRLRRQGGSPRQVLALSLIGAVVLASFASRDLVSWLDRMGGGPILETVQRAAGDWDGAMDRLGLVRPHEALRQAVGEVLDWRW